MKYLDKIPPVARDAIERALATFLQAFIAVYMVGGTDVLQNALVAGLAAVLSLVKAKLATRVGDPDSASLTV
jgi:hypothetical protein